MRIFVDANVLVAVLNRQLPLYPYAARVLSLSDRSGFDIYTSPICLAIAFYFAEKKCGTMEAKRKIAILTEKLSIADVNQEVVSLASNNPAVHDFEDGLEYYSAVQAGCQVIVTEDMSDFYYSEIMVCNCTDFINDLRFRNN